MLGKKCQFQKHVFFANWAILSKKKLRNEKFFHKIFCLPELVWSRGPLRNSVLRVSEVQGSMPLRGSSFLNLVWVIETGCEINWHFEFIYKVCSTHSTLGKATAPASTSQHQAAAPRSTTQQHQAPGSSSSTTTTQQFKALQNVLVFPLRDWFQQQLWICCPKPKAKAEKGCQGYPEEQPSSGRLKTRT